MPLTYRIDAEAGLLLLTAEGVVTQAERLATLKAWLADPAFRPGLDALCDFSAAASTPALAELEALIAVVKQHGHAIGRSRVAIIAGKPVVFGVARQFGALASESPLVVRAFRERNEALSWLRKKASAEEET